jgi:hypothetical protein
MNEADRYRRLFCRTEYLLHDLVRQGSAMVKLGHKMCFRFRFQDNWSCRCINISSACQPYLKLPGHRKETPYLEKCQTLPQIDRNGETPQYSKTIISKNFTSMADICYRLALAPKVTYKKGVWPYLTRWHSTDTWHWTNGDSDSHYADLQDEGRFQTLDRHEYILASSTWTG